MKCIIEDQDPKINSRNSTKKNRKEKYNAKDIRIKTRDWEKQHDVPISKCYFYSQSKAYLYSSKKVRIAKTIVISATHQELLLDYLFIVLAGYFYS